MGASPLKELLPNDFPYIITESNYSSPDNFSCTLRVKLKNEEEFRTFLNKFESRTNTNWILCRSISESRKFLFSRDYLCHHAAHRKKALDDNTVKCNKNKECKAKLTVRIKHNTTRVRYRDKFAKEGYISIINILFVHTHKINNAESWHWLKRAPEITEMFIEYFNKGMSPSEAMMYHEDKLSSEDPQSIGNGRKNPPQHWVYDLRNKWLGENFGGLKDGDSFLTVAKSKAESYRKDGCKILIDDDPVSIVFVTPLMQRQLDVLEYSSFFIDTSESCDQANTALTLILVATKAGAVPIACALHENQTESNYIKIFRMMKALWGTCIVHKITNFMTDDSDTLKNALFSVFPSVRQLLCHFHVLQALWRWVVNSKNNILSNHRIYLMNLFKKVIHALNIEEMNQLMDDINKDPVAVRYQNFIAHVNKIFECSSEICMALRTEIPSNQNNANNYTEATFRIIKDFILRRVKAYNAVALMDFLVNILDRYYGKKILNTVFGCTNKSTLLHEKLVKKSKMFIDKGLIAEKGGFYMVQSENNDEIWYEVDISFCSCLAALKGAFCRHQCAVKLKYNLEFPNAPQLSVDDKKKMFEVAMYKSYSCSDSFLKRMMDTSDEFKMDSDIMDSDIMDTSSETMNNLSDIKVVSKENMSSSNQISVSNEMPNDNRSLRDVPQHFEPEVERITSLLQENTSDEILMNVAEREIKKLQNIHTPAKLHSFFANSKLSCRATFDRKISVQAASLARRKKKAADSLYSRVSCPSKLSHSPNIIKLEAA